MKHAHAVVDGLCFGDEIGRNRASGPRVLKGVIQNLLSEDYRFLEIGVFDQIADECRPVIYKMSVRTELVPRLVFESVLSLPVAVACESQRTTI